MNTHKPQNHTFGKTAVIAVFLMCVWGLFNVNNYIYAEEDREELIPVEEGFAGDKTDDYTEEELLEGYLRSVMYENLSVEDKNRIYAAEDETLQQLNDIVTDEVTEFNSTDGKVSMLFSTFAAAAPKSSKLYSSLNDYQKPIYDELLRQIYEVAEGKRTNTEFTVYLDAGLATENDAEKIAVPKNEFTFNELNAADANEAYANFKAEYVEFTQLYNTLLYNNPYSLYWHDKVKGGTFTAKVSAFKSRDAIVIKSMTFKFSVSQDYSNGVDTEGRLLDTDVSMTGAVNTAIANAQAVVQANSNKNDYLKLCAYRDYICEQVSYNYDATDDMPYGNPWQLIYVFDGDSSTNVVCEGYAKAFKYLCDLSSFDSPNIVCLLMGGRMKGAGGSGGHMWNIVRMEDGASYLVDLTNSDSGSSWAGELFLSGYTDKKEDSSFAPTCVEYYYSYSRGYFAIRYYSFSKLEEYYGDSPLLQLSSHDYVPEHIHNYVDGYCAGCDTYENSVYTHMSGYSLTVGSDLTMNVYMSEDDLYYAQAENYVEFVKPDNTSVKVTVANAIKQGEYYIFPITVSAECMTDIITAYVCKADGSRCVSGDESNKGNLLQYRLSVKDYADRLINSGECSSSVKKYVKTLLLYGGAIQRSENYNTDAVADSGITLKNAGIKTATDKEIMAGINKRTAIIKYSDRNSHPVKYKALGMNFSEGKPQLKVYLEFTSGEIYTVKAAGQMTDILHDEKGDYVVISGINPYNFSKQYTVSVCDGTGEEKISVTAGIYNWISMILKGEISADSATKELSRRMYYLGRYGRG